MSINTTNEKLALIEYGDVFQPGIPISADGIGQDDKQQLLWDYPGILWGAAAAEGGAKRKYTWLRQQRQVDTNRELMDIARILIKSGILN